MKRRVGMVLAAWLACPPASWGASGPLQRAIVAHAARLAVAPAQAVSAPATDRAVALRWSELGPVVSGRRVTAVLSDGSRVTGDAVVVRDDALVLDVARSTGTRDYGNGNAPIPKADIAVIEVERYVGAGRSLGIVLGVLAGVVIGGWVSAEAADSAGVGIPLFLGVASGITLAGYYAGKSMSRRVTVIRIVP